VDAPDLGPGDGALGPDHSQPLQQITGAPFISDRIRAGTVFCRCHLVGFQQMAASQPSCMIASDLRGPAGGLMAASAFGVGPCPACDLPEPRRALINHPAKLFRIKRSYIPASDGSLACMETSAWVHVRHRGVPRS